MIRPVGSREGLQIMGWPHKYSTVVTGARSSRGDSGMRCCPRRGQIGTTLLRHRLLSAGRAANWKSVALSRSQPASWEAWHQRRGGLRPRPICMRRCSARPAAHRAIEFAVLCISLCGLCVKKMNCEGPQGAAEDPQRVCWARFLCVSVARSFFAVPGVVDDR